MAAKEEATVATTSMAYQAMEPEWYKMSTLLEGTPAMRAAGEEMTPAHENEKDTQWEERVNGCVLFNVTDLTLKTWVGKPFAASIQYTEDFDEEVKEHTDDINLQGDNVDVFAREWFAKGISHALSHVMVDYPTVTHWPGRSLADDKRENVRPYAVHVQPEDMIFAESQRIDGVETLTHVRIKELKVSRIGWEENVEELIRVYDLQWIEPDLEGTADEFRTNDLIVGQLMVRVGTWSYNEDEKKWFETDISFMDIDEIPLVTFYSNRTGFMTGKSPLLDLADLNIRHWQSTSDQNAILTVARFPLLACSGGNDEDNKLIIGPKNWLFSEEPMAKFYYVEHSGKAIAAGETDLKNIEERMKSYGAEFMKEGPDRQTASARNLDSSEATSPLQDTVGRFNDALNRVFRLMAKWDDKKMTGKAFLPTDFQAPEAASLQVLLDTWKEGGLSSDAYLKELQRRSLLDEHFDFAKNKAAAKKDHDDRTPNVAAPTVGVAEED